VREREREYKTWCTVTSVKLKNKVKNDLRILVYTVKSLFKVSFGSGGFEYYAEEILTINGGFTLI
jgi:hypothetical protein